MKFPSYADLFGTDHQDQEFIATPWGELERNPYHIAQCPDCGAARIDARGYCHNPGCCGHGHATADSYIAQGTYDHDDSR